MAGTSNVCFKNLAEDTYSTHKAGAGGNDIEYEDYAAAWRGFFAADLHAPEPIDGPEEVPLPSGAWGRLCHMALNQDRAEFSAAFADELAEFVERGRMRNVHEALPPGKGVVPFWSERYSRDMMARLVRQFRVMVDASVRNAFGTTDPEVMPRWYAKAWNRFWVLACERLLGRYQYLRALRRRMRSGLVCETKLLGRRIPTQPAGMDMYTLRTSVELMIELAQGCCPYMESPLLNERSLGVQCILLSMNRTEDFWTRFRDSENLRNEVSCQFVWTFAKALLRGIYNEDPMHRDPFNWSGTFGQLIGSAAARQMLARVGALFPDQCSAVVALCGMMGTPDGYIAQHEALQASRAKKRALDDDAKSVDACTSMPCTRTASSSSSSSGGGGGGSCAGADDDDVELTPPSTPFRQTSTEDDNMPALFASASFAEAVAKKRRIVPEVTHTAETRCVLQKQSEVCTEIGSARRALSL